MGLFSKNKKEKKTERNEIENKQLKEVLANTALQLLIEGEDYNQLAYTQCQFGYVFDVDDHGIEALYKIITDKGTIYFAAQKTKVMRLNFNEELYQNTIDTFLSMHQ